MCPFVSDFEENCKERGTSEDEVEEEQENIHQQEGERSSIEILHDIVNSPPPQRDIQDQHFGPILDEISSPINTQIFDFCDPDMFSDTLQDSDTTSSPNNCCYEVQNSCYNTTNITFPSNFVDSGNNHFSNNNEYSGEPLVSNKYQGGHINEQNANISTTSSTTTIATTTTTNSCNHPNNNNPHHNINCLSIIFDSPNEIDNNDISASIDFSAPMPPPYNINTSITNSTNSTTTQQDQYYHLPLCEVGINNNSNNNSNELHHYTTPMGPISLPFIGGPLGPVLEDDGLTPIPPFLRIDPSSTTSSTSSCSFLNPSSMSSFLSGNLNSPCLGGEKNGLFTSSLLMASNLQAKELDFQGDNSGIFCSDQLPQVYNSGDMQAFSGESSQLVSATSNSAPLATEISSLEDSTFKVGKLSAEQRKEKIHRYLKKRNERNFSKKIKYACRKTLADSRPRVRGRFAKNDDFVEVNTRHMNDHHEEEDYDEVAVKDEDDFINSSDIFSHISGVNSFKCNYQIQSWI